ncbi:MAG TPA: tetratricopeptide repeat protein [Candidatus Solibacter sp.]|nr:tetratricopeptide repeat protein [Candidatus Solibacter sp.]
MNNTRVIIAFIVILGLSIASSAISPSGAPPQAEHLGRVRFANSCSPQVQVEFNSAVAMLHSFQYGLAEKTFLHVLKKDPQCAIAYWGAAMTLYHQLWDSPTAEALKQGRDYLLSAKRLRKKNAREVAYLNAAWKFYQPEQNLGKMSRVQIYSDAMLDLHQRYPKDDDATAFYALSLLTLPDDADLTNQKNAIAILTKLFAAQPEHPGAAHYLIHAADTAELAPLALDAARRYARIAPSSPHALHMPAHIFAHLGMWQEAIESNLASLAAAEEATKSGRDDGSGDALHAMMYLTYAYLQIGDDESARNIVERIKSVPEARPNDIMNDHAILEALYSVETHDWKQASMLISDPGTFPYARIRTYWARAIGSARSGDVMAARRDIEKLDQARAGMVEYMQSVNCQMHTGHSVKSEASVQQLEAKAWLAWAERKPTEALETMQAAVAMEDSFSVESRTVPASEMLGDLLLELHQPESAAIAYAAVLKAAPARLNALAGAARASRAMGNRDAARSYYEALVKCCTPDATRNEFGEAKLFLSGN